MDMNAPAIRLTDITFSYPDGRRTLEGVSFEVREGERVALIGPNGAGKSTLLLHLNGILQGKGRVEIFGLPVERANLRTVRGQVGLVFQDPDDQLFCPTVHDDVAFGPRHMRLPEAEVAARVARSLAAVGLPEIGARSAFHMSFGEKKRVALATVLAMEARILALDEPTSNLDPRARRELIELLGRLGSTQMIVTHDLDLVRRHCTRAILLSRGRCVADAAPAALLDNAAMLLEHGLA